MRKISLFIVTFAFCAILLAGCMGTPTPSPQYSPIPTRIPTATSSPSPTPIATPVPVQTPPATQAPQVHSVPSLTENRITQEKLSEWIAAYDYLGGIHEFETEVLRLLNIEREAHGLNPLLMDDTLAMAARFKSQEMFDLEYFDHTSPVYGEFFVISDEVFGLGAYGENIAMGQRTPEEVMLGWMNSPAHRDNILSERWAEIGIGFYEYHWTQKFR